MPPLRFSLLLSLTPELPFLRLSIRQLAHMQGPGRLQLDSELRRPWVKLLPCAGLRSQRRPVQPTPLADQAVPTRTFFLATGLPRGPLKTALLTAPRLRNAVVSPDNRISGLAAVRPEPRASRVLELTR